MSVETVAIVLHHSQARGTDKVILLGIANHSGDGGAWPAVDTLVKYAHVDERSVRRSLRRLEALGELAVHVQAGGSSGLPAWRRPNRYDVLLACPAECDRTANHRVRGLWITGGTPTSGGDAHVRGVGTPTSPEGGTPTSPEPSLEPSPQIGVETDSQVTDARASDERPCSICSRQRWDCEARVHVSGHEYKPETRGGAA